MGISCGKCVRPPAQRRQMSFVRLVRSAHPERAACYIAVITLLIGYGRRVIAPGYGASARSLRRPLQARTESTVARDIAQVGSHGRYFGRFLPLTSRIYGMSSRSPGAYLAAARRDCRDGGAPVAWELYAVLKSAKACHVAVGPILAAFG